MRVRVEAAALAAQTAWAGRVLPARPSVPVLAGLLLQAGPDGLEVAAYDYETAARAAVEAQVAQEGRVLLPGAVLAAATAALPEGEAVLEVDAAAAVLSCGGATYRIPVLAVEDYPDVPRPGAAAGRAQGLRGGVERTAVAADPASALPVLTGVRLRTTPDGLEASATDRYRAARARIGWTPAADAGELDVLAPAGRLAWAAKTIDADEVEVGSEQGVVWVADARRAVLMRTIDADPPDLDRFMAPPSGGVVIEAQAEELAAAVRRAAVMCAKTTPIRLEGAEEEHLVLLAEDPDGGGAVRAQAPARVSGLDALTGPVAWNPRFLLDALGALRSARVRLAAADTAKPCLLTPLDEDGRAEQGYAHLVMCVRLST